MLIDMAAYPRLLLGDEEIALHGLAGGLDSVIDVYDVTSNEIVTFGSTTSPPRARWIVRYPNETYGESLLEGIDDQLPGHPADRPRELPLREPKRPEGAQGAGHYTSPSVAPGIGHVDASSQPQYQPAQELVKAMKVQSVGIVSHKSKA